MASMHLASALAAAALLPGVQAWGNDGHTIVAHIADALLDPAVNKALISDLGKESLSDAATWCDDYDHTPLGKWSESLHFINYPGQACSFDWSRDCKDDVCNVGAIANYTKQVWDRSLPADQRLTALNFMMHMMGDVHQPLHVASADDRGGNDISVHYSFTADGGSKRSGNLHAVWDGRIIEQMIDDLKASALETSPPPFHDWQVLNADILKRVKGDWASNTTAWRSTVADKNHNVTEYRAGLSAVAQETAVDSCTYAYVKADGTTRIQSGDELDMDYYQRNKPVVALQLAKAGARLAQILEDSLHATRTADKIFV